MNKAFQLAEEDIEALQQDLTPEEFEEYCNGYGFTSYDFQGNLRRDELICNHLIDNYTVAEYTDIMGVVDLVYVVRDR